MDSIYITALLVGLLGGVHCLGMCGGVVGGLTFSLETRVQTSWWKMLPYQLLFNVGRISSYMIIGAIFGAFGVTLGSLVTFMPAQQLLQLLAGLFMVSLGLYLGGWWFGLAKIELAGQHLWKRLAPFVSRLTPVKHYHQAWLYGLVWGWLPCGLIYSMLIMAMTAGSAVNGAALMLAFGLGTLPNLLLMGIFAFYFTKLSRMVWVKRVAGFSVLTMGIWQVYLAYSINI